MMERKPTKPNNTKKYKPIYLINTIGKLQKKKTNIIIVMGKSKTIAENAAKQSKLCVTITKNIKNKLNSASWRSTI